MIFRVWDLKCVRIWQENFHFSCSSGGTSGVLGGPPHFPTIDPKRSELRAQSYLSMVDILLVRDIGFSDEPCPAQVMVSRCWCLRAANDQLQFSNKQFHQFWIGVKHLMAYTIVKYHKHKNDCWLLFQSIVCSPRLHLWFYDAGLYMSILSPHTPGFSQPFTTRNPIEAWTASVQTRKRPWPEPGGWGKPCHGPPKVSPLGTWGLKWLE